MASLEQKREAFRKYLESAGAIDCLSKALIKLYQEDQKPENACKFIRQTLCENCPTDEEVEASMAELDEARVRIKALEREVRGFTLNKRKSASEVDLALEAGFESLVEDEQCNSLLKKHLTREVLDELKGKKTALKSTLLDCIQSGVKNHDSHVGLYAADPGAYEVFADLFDAVIDEYHGGFAKDSQHPALEWGDVSLLDNPDPEGEYIKSTRVRCARSIEGFPFNPRLTEDQYEEIFSRVKTVLEGLPEELSGVIQPLETMDKDTQQELTESHLLFKEGDRFLEAAKSNRFWPVGRAIFLNESRTFIVWVNEEDHLRIISMQQGGDLGNVYQRLITAIELISKDIAFVRDERLGYLTFCPSNLGTTIRASVHMKLPKLSANKEKLDELVAEHHLQIRGTHGEHTESESGVFDVSNKRRLGLTEFDALKEMNDGIKALIAMEKELGENGGGEEAPAAEPEPAAEE